VNFIDEMAETLLEKGIAELNLNHLDSAEVFFTEAANQAVSIAGDAGKVLQGRAYGNIGNIYGKRGKEREAISFNERSLAIFRELGDTERCAVVLFNLALFHDKLKSYKQAESCMTECSSLTKDPQRSSDAKKFLDGYAKRKSTSSLGANSTDASASSTSAGTDASGISHSTSHGSVGASGASKSTGSSSTASAASVAALASAAAQVNPANGSISPNAANTTSIQAATGVLISTSRSTEFTPFETIVKVSSLTSDKSTLAEKDALISLKSPASVNARGAGERNPSLAIGGGGGSTPMLEFGFENLWYGDLQARNERESLLLDNVIAMLKGRAYASEVYAKSMTDAGNALNSSLSTTGLGVSGTISGAPKQVTTKIFEASLAGISSMRSAFGSLLGSVPSGAGASSSSASSSSSGSQANDHSFVDLRDESSSNSVGTGGYDSLHATLSDIRATFQRDAQNATATAQAIRDVVTSLTSFKSIHSNKVSKVLGRGNELVKTTQNCLSNLKRANTQLERARKDVDDTAERLRSAQTAPNGVIPKTELVQREALYHRCVAAARAAEDAVRDASDSVISSRKQRDEELTFIARSLQACDEERRAAIARALRSLALHSSEAADLSLEIASKLTFVSQQPDDAADTRMFIHARRSAIMLEELWSRQGKKGAAADPQQAGSATDEVARLIPSPLAASASLVHSKEYIQRESEVAPIMYKWSQMLLENSGSESLEDIKGDVTHIDARMLNETCARTAFLRALSSKRSQKQNVGDAFSRFVSILWWALDACVTHEDAKGASTVLILSETFYRVLDSNNQVVLTQVEMKLNNDDDDEEDVGEKNGTSPSTPGKKRLSTPSVLPAGFKKEFVQSYLRFHPIWSVAFWEESFYRAVREEVMKLIDPTSASNSRLVGLFSAVDVSQGAPMSPDPTPTKKAAGGISNKNSTGSSGDASSATSEENLYAYTQIIFGQLMALSVNMTSFGVPKHEVSGLVLSLAAGNGLPKDMRDSLKGIMMVEE
jgi:Tetratricopeptide repeat